MIENNIVEYKGVQYVKVPYIGTDCGDCVFYDKSANECDAGSEIQFWGCNEKFIWKKLEKDVKK